MSDFAVRSFIKLELLGVTEMLKDLTVFIGNCNFHNGISFAIFVGFFCFGSLHPAATAAVSCLLSSADAVVSPGDVQRFPVHKTRCDLAPCAFVNLLHGRAGNIHLRGTLLVVCCSRSTSRMTSYSSSVSRIGSVSPHPLGQNVSTCGVPQIRRHRGGLGMGMPPFFCFRYIPIITHWTEKSNILFKSRCNFHPHVTELRRA